MTNRKVIVGIIAVIILFLGFFTFATNVEEPIIEPSIEEGDDNGNVNGNENNDNNTDEGETGELEELEENEGVNEGQNTGGINNNQNARPGQQAQQVVSVVTINNVEQNLNDVKNSMALVIDATGDNLEYSLVFGTIVVPWQTTNTFNVTENRTYTVRVRNNVTNTTDEKDVTVMGIDDVAPEVVDVVYLPDITTNTDVVVTITFSEEIKDLTGWTKDATDPKVWTKTYTANGSETVSYEDLAGNKGVDVSINVTNIDKEAATVELRYVSYTGNYDYKNTKIDHVNLGKRIAIRFRTNEEIDIDNSIVTIAGQRARISKNNAQTTVFEYVAEINVLPTATEGVVQFVLNIFDIVGNETPEIITETAPLSSGGRILVDLTNPVVESVIITPNNYTNKDVTVVITFSEEVKSLVGLDWIQDTTNPKVWTKIYTENKSETVSYEDLAGNSGVDEVINVTNIDVESPIVTNVTIDKNLVKVGDIIKITATVIDSQSGVKAVTADFSYDTNFKNNRPTIKNTTMTKVSENTYEATYTVPEGWNDGTIYIAIAARDNVDNYEGNRLSALTIIVDNTAPSKPLITSRDGYIAGIWVNHDVTLDFHSTDNVTAPENLRYEYNTGSGPTGWRSISNPRTFTSNVYNNVYVRAIDEAGNISPVSTFFQVKVDKTPPKKPKIDTNGYTSDIPTSENVYLRSYGSEEVNNTGTQIASESPIKYQYRINEGPWINSNEVEYLSETNSKVEFRVVDEAGNISPTSEIMVIIDRTAPIGKVTYNTTELTNNDVTATLTLNEDGIVTSSGWIQRSSKTFTKVFESNVITETVEFKDLAGNTNSANVLINNIDKVPPIITLSGAQTLEMGLLDYTFNVSGSYSAWDDVDGDITSRVNVTIPSALKRYHGVVTILFIVPETAGSYDVIYAVSDTAGNNTTATRTLVYRSKVIEWIQSIIR